MMDEITFFFCVLFGRGMSREMRKEGRKEGKKERRKEGRKERRKEGRNENEEIPPLFYNETRSFCFSILVYILLFIRFSLMSTQLAVLVVLSTLSCLLKFPFTLVKVVKSDNLVGMRSV